MRDSGETIKPERYEVGDMNGYWKLYAKIFFIKVCRRCGERLDKEYKKRRRGKLCITCFIADIDYNNRYRQKNNSRAKLRYSLHPTSRLINRRNSYCKQNGIQGKYSLNEWELKLKEYDYRCAYCKGKVKLTTDHVIPITRGGANFISNIVPACKSCNSQKGDKTAEEFREYLVRKNLCIKINRVNML